MTPVTKPTNKPPSEREMWEAWERGEARCPYCIGESDEDFAAMCDCSRHSWETTGKPFVIGVVGTDIAVEVPPHSFKAELR